MGDEQPPAVDGRRPGGDAEPTLAGTGRGRVPGRNPRRIGDAVLMAAVVVATATAAAIIGVASGLLTLLGWGAAVVAVLVAVGIAAAIRPRPTNGWILVPLLALALPSAAVAISGVRVLPQRGAVVEAPATVAEIPSDGYRTGFGDLLVDLRNLDARDGDEIVVAAGSDLGRTVVALPRNRCFNLDVRWRTGNLRLPRIRERRTVVGLHPRSPLRYLGSRPPKRRRQLGAAPGRIVLFGHAYAAARGRWSPRSDHDGAPTITVELTSRGGSFVVRDYPDHVFPLRTTDWPIDQPLPRPSSDDIGDKVEREMRTILAGLGPAARRRAQTGVRVKAEAHRRVHYRRLGRDADRRGAFASKWARRVTGTCNPPGAFR